MIVDLDVLAAAGAALALAAGMPRVVRAAGGRSRALEAVVGLGSAAAVVAAHVPVAAGALLIAGLAARRRCADDGAAPAAWAFLGDALVAAGLGAGALDAGEVALPWVDGGPVAGWVPALVAVGALLRLLTTGLVAAPVVVAVAVIGVRLDGLPAAGEAPVWLVGAVALAVALAWVGCPVSAVAGLGWAALGVGDGSAGAGAFLLAGAAILVVGEAVVSDQQGVGWAERSERLRSRVPTPPATGVGVLGALAVVPAGVALVRVPTGDAPETVPLLLGLLAVVALVARVPDGLRHPVTGVVVAALTVPLLAPGWWAARLEVSDAARGATDALTDARPGSVVALVVAGAVGVVAWVVARSRSRAR